ncbi:MAG: hypothetical protein AAB421_05210 [Patescibacteria group bacterium]
MDIYMGISIGAWVLFALAFAKYGTIEADGQQVFCGPVDRFVVGLALWPLLWFVLYALGWVATFALLPLRFLPIFP